MVDISTVIQALKESGFIDIAASAADAVLPTCAYCHRKAVPVKCFRCGSYVCQTHGYFSVAERDALCVRCKRELLRIAGELDTDADPWEVLGIPEGSPVREIERAFRKAALRCHPDRHPDDPEKAKQFARIQWAREEALRQVE